MQIALNNAKVEVLNKMLLYGLRIPKQYDVVVVDFQILQITV
jgi:hypothetical protein